MGVTLVSLLSPVSLQAVVQASRSLPSRALTFPFTPADCVRQFTVVYAMAAMMTIRGFPSSLPEAEIKGLLETIGQVSSPPLRFVVPARARARRTPIPEFLLNQPTADLLYPKKLS